MAFGRNIQELEIHTGDRFADIKLLETALTHSSFTNECRKDSAVPSNERMEFLGDAVLQIIISDYLYDKYPGSAEGHLTKNRQHLVCEGTLAKLAKKIHLGEFLILGKGEEQSGRTNDSILADAFEALLAAIYLDTGKSTDFLSIFLMGLMKEEIEHCEKNRGGDYKTKLQQLVQQDGREKLSYVVTAESGPDHNKTFEVDAMLNSENVIGHGIGHSKREAEQAAAREALRLFGVENI